MRLFKSDYLFNKISKYIFLSIILLLTACTSPEDKANKYYNEGLKLLDKGEYVKANIQFRNALQINRNMVDAVWGQVLVAEKTQNWQGVFNLLNKVISIDPKHLAAHVKLGRIYLIAGKLDKALEYSDKSISLSDSDNAALALRAAILLKLENPKSAVEYANRVISKEPGYADALIVLATERLLAGDSLKAIEYLDQGLDKDDTNIALQLIKVQALDALAELDKAEEIYKRLIELYPDTPAFNYALAQFYIKHNRIPDAEIEYRSVVKNNPEDHDARVKLVRFLNNYVSVESGRKQLEKFVEDRPDDFNVKFTLVEFYLVKKNYMQAHELLDKIILTSASAENTLKAKGIKAGALLASGDSTKALNLVNDILSEDSRNEQALILKSKIDIDRQRYDDAIADLRTILRDNPRSSRALLLLAQTHNLSGSPELADEQYLRALRASRLNPSYGLQYASFLLKRKQPERAEDILEDVLSVHPRDLATLKFLAKIRLLLGDWVGAQQVADTIKLLGDEANVSTQIKGAILTGKREYSESVALLKQTFEESPGDVKPVVALVRTYLVSGKPQEAANFLDAVINANPENIDIYILRAQVHLSQGQLEEALTVYKKVVEIAGDSPVGYYYMAITQIKMDKTKDAKATLAKGIKVAPDNFSLRITLAGMMEKEGDADKAIELYEQLLNDGIDSDIVANNLALLLAEHRTDKDSLNRAYVLSQRFKRSDVPHFKDTLGWTSYKVGKYSEADRLLKEAVEQLPDVPDVHYHLGMNYLAKKDPQNAKKSLEKALELAGDSDFDKEKEIRTTLNNL